MIPVLQVSGKGIAETWERSLEILYKNGMRIRTEYDKPKDPPSIDATMIMVASNPLSEPRIHLSIPSTFKDLKKYEKEVVEGVHDHWIDPERGKWTYTYHQRLFNYPSSKGHVNQVNYAVNKLADAPYTRRAQAITWNPELDPHTNDPPCLQRIWLRCTEEDGILRLNMNTHWRSRDAYKAAFMNMYALTELQRRVALGLSEKLKRHVGVGQYTDISDSYHIYGSYLEDFTTRFLRALEQRRFYSDDIRNSRTIAGTHPIVLKEFKQALSELESERKTTK
ncbi:MAG: thymidylate synthase [Nitrososphaeria archaeon]